ncbi:MAG: 5'/3'-nucleotidase SurE [Thermoproteota archaeon]
MFRILVTNDDGYLSPGLYLLYEAVKELGEARIYSTEYPRSAIARTISFNCPLRLVERRYLGYKVYVTDGTPIDAFYLAMGVHKFRPNIVVSGINVGENLTLQHIYYSGTVAVAIEAALHGIPSIAFSADIMGYEEFDDPVFSSAIKVIAKELVSYVLSKGLPSGIDVLSVNIPSPSRIRSCVSLLPAARLRWRAEFETRLDTRGRPYYWLRTVPLEGEEGTDIHALERGCTVVTPLSVDLNVSARVGQLEGLEGVLRSLELLLKKALGSAA